MPTIETTSLKFIHLPHTGGHWVTAVIEKLEPVLMSAVEYHASHTWGTPGKFSFGIVRDTFSWYESCHRFHTETAWQFWPEMAGLDFDSWVKRYHHSGLSYSHVIEYQLGIPPKVDYVGCFERLESSTRNALILAGFPKVDVIEAVRSTPPLKVFSR